MNISEIKIIAKKHDIKFGKKTKEQLILSIQKREGNITCFKTDRKYNCPETQCLWEIDCKKGIK